MKRVKTQRLQADGRVLGIIIFIDDYFNSLAVGQIARPVTDRHNVSRAKLAYIVDSTSAPITVISPISSSGAYILGIFGSIFIANGITESAADLKHLCWMIPMNFYALAAIFLVFIDRIFKLILVPMRTHETRAMETGELLRSRPEDGSRGFSDQIKAKLKRKGISFTHTNL